MGSDGQINFGTFCLDRDNALLLCAGQPVGMTPKALDMLHYLASRPDRLVTKQELLSALWPDGWVGDASIKVCVSEIRRTLRDDAERPQYIQTVFRRGYRFIAPVLDEDDSQSAVAWAPPPVLRGRARVGAVRASDLRPSSSGSTQPPPQPSPGVPEEGAKNHRRLAGGVGRRRELSSLHDAFESACTGHGQVICVTGETGIGKTTVIENLLRQLAAEGHDFYVARGRCSERLAGAEAYVPLLEAIESLARGEASESLARALRTRAPAWYAEVGPLDHANPSAAPSNKPASQQRLKRELIGFLEEVAQDRPLVLFLDDIHWADASTIDVLAYIADRCAQLRLLLVLTYRPTEMKLSDHPWGPVQLELQSRGLCREIPLAFLSRAEVEDYLALAFCGHRFDPEFVDLIFNSTEGSPLFLVDLLRYLNDCGVIARDSQAWVVGKPVPDFRSEFPPSVRSLIQRKLEQLGAADSQLLSVACVQGSEFDSAVLARVLGIDAIELEERLEALDRVHGLVRQLREQELPDGTLTVRYQFVHILYQNALYAALQPGRRAAWSGAVAKSLVAMHGNQCPAIAATVAVLFEAARDYSSAIEYLMVAARNAVRICASSEAMLLTRRGLALVEKLSDPVERDRQELRLQMLLIGPLQFLKGYAAEDVRLACARSRELCKRLGEGALLVPAFWGLTAYFLMRGEMSMAAQITEEFSALAQKEGDPAYLILANQMQSTVLFYLADFERALDYARQVIEDFEPALTDRLIAFCGRHPAVMACGFAASALWVLGYPDQALMTVRQGMALAEASGHPFALMHGHYFMSKIHRLRREPAETRDAAEATLALADEYQAATYMGAGRVFHGWAIAHLDQPEQGEAEIRRGMEICHSSGGMVNSPQMLAMLAEVCALREQFDGAISAVDLALTLVNRTGERFYEGELHRLHGELLLQRSPDDLKTNTQAEHAFRNALELARCQRTKSVELRAGISLTRLYRQQARLPEGRAMLSEIYSGFAEGFDTPDLQEAKSLLDQPARICLAHANEAGARLNLQ
ncbi:MAG TPA: AAA family ATPase [Humisphaera sp.]|jgi:DNA-binding winged helix-turn-helix (wHTH) protein/predicted ATPase|nr:AAA family ATPase [Humisphaera sp.]